MLRSIIISPDAEMAQRLIAALEATGKVEVTRTLTRYPTAIELVRSLRALAPEILFKQPYTQKADVYSYGIVLFEILTQTMPWNELPSKFLTRSSRATPCGDGGILQ